ncbi:MAG: hypothetical protein AB1746_15440 [Candidatus Zixiibacteriota bacterium]
MMKKMKALVLLFAFLAIFIGGFTTMTAPQANAIKCCWVMVCTINPPIICWEECRPCPRL